MLNIFILNGFYFGKYLITFTPEIVQHFILLIFLLSNSAEFERFF